MGAVKIWRVEKARREIRTRNGEREAEDRELG